MRGRILRRAVAGLTALAALVTAQTGTATSSSAATLPGGRRTFVVSMMDGRTNAIAVRVAVYTFSTNGTVTERYWAWRQDGISGKRNVRWTKPSSGYSTAGCPHNCPVRTPVGFQSGNRGNVFTGRWSMNSDVLTIRWTSGSTPEQWRIRTGQPGIAGAELLSNDSNRNGWGIGSNASPDAGVPLSSVYNGTGWITGPFAENAYASTTRHMDVGWSQADYTLCSSGHCMQSRKMSGGDLRSWYHSYFAANPSRDGRKVFWNNQTGAVAQLENPGTQCISASGGGHTNALLQALDDNGNFVGFVGVEASLEQRKYGQAVVAAYLMMRPEMLSAIGR
jgi:hypothetical protein